MVNMFSDFAHTARHTMEVSKLEIFYLTFYVIIKRIINMRVVSITGVKS